MVSIVGSQAEQCDVVIDAGFDFDLVVPVTDIAADGSETPSDLTGWTARAVCRTQPGALVALFDVACDITSAPTETTVAVHLGGDETADYQWVSGVWELYVTDDTHRRLLLEGTATVEQTVAY